MKSGNHRNLPEGTSAQFREKTKDRFAKGIANMKKSKVSNGGTGSCGPRAPSKDEMCKRNTTYIPTDANLKQEQPLIELQGGTKKYNYVG